MQSTGTSGTNAYGKAVVIGSSIAGLVAARILTNHFAQVFIIERDHLTGDLTFRKGVPHARHPHVLLVKGQLILEELFPGFTQELLEAGAISLNAGLDWAMYIFGKWRIYYPSDVTILSCSRPLLEGTLYHRLTNDPKVTFIPEAEATHLCVDASKKQATGVRWRSRKNGSDGEQELTADLIVDASGRDSRAPTWLQDLGYTPPEETVVNAFPGYATCIYKRPPYAADLPWKIMAMLPTPETGKRGGVIFPMEGDTWMATLVGMVRDYPPTDEKGYLEFARSLPDPAFYEAVKDAEPITPPYGYRRAENRLRHYGQLPRYLENFLVFGDAVYAFNPIYGQGMTVAALSSLEMDRCLHEQRRQTGNGDLSGLAQRFQKQLVPVITGPWQMATGQDRLWAITEGTEKLDVPTKIMQSYMNSVIRTALVDARVTEPFFKVQHMLATPPSLFHPAIMWSILKRALRP